MAENVGNSWQDVAGLKTGSELQEAQTALEAAQRRIRELEDLIVAAVKVSIENDTPVLSEGLIDECIEIELRRLGPDAYKHVLNLLEA